MKTYTTRANVNRAAKKIGLTQDDYTINGTEKAWFWDIPEEARILKNYGVTVCPHCKTHLLRGASDNKKTLADTINTLDNPDFLEGDNATVTRDILEVFKDITQQYSCNSCFEDFGPTVSFVETVDRGLDQLDAVLAAAKAKEDQPEVKQKPTPKLILEDHRKISKVANPCSMVWSICEDMADAKRKDVIAECEKQGIAYYTARTQYQYWKRASKEDAANKEK